MMEILVTIITNFDASVNRKQNIITIACEIVTPFPSFLKQAPS